MQALNIALFTYSTKPRGGVVHTLCLAEKLQQLNNNVHVYALETDKGFFREVEVPYTLIPCPKDNFSSMDEKIHAYIQYYIDYLSSNKEVYDIYHAEDCISANALLEIRKKGLINFFLRTVHHLDEFTSQSLIECQLKSILQPDYLLAVSKYWENELMNEYSLRSERITNGVDLERFRSTDNKRAVKSAKQLFSVEGCKVLLTIGGIEPRKNTKTTLSAFNIARSHFISKGERLVWLIGGGETLFDYREYRKEFFSEMESLGLKPDEDIYVLGNVPEEKIKDLYYAGDVFLFPSVKEGWGLVVLEAMASGLPVIASEIEPLTEFLKDGNNSLLASPMDYELFSENIIKVIEDDKLNNKLVEGGLKTANLYSWETTAEGHLAIYENILKNSQLITASIEKRCN